ncbi:MAG TPA: prenyltransferase [Candidatus Elarobacter sp.]
MRALLAFIRLSRPLFLFGGFAGVALGAAVAARTGHAVDLATYGWVQLLVTSFQLMVHYANDYFDCASDRRAVPTPWSGGSGVLASGALPRRTALVAAVFWAAYGALVATRFALTGNAVAAELSFAILILAWMYSAPPLRLAWRGLGELDTALVVAVLVPAVAYAAFARSLDARLFAAASPGFIAMLAMMLCVELPDAGWDYLSGKRTLVVRFGAARTWVIAAALAGAASTVGLALGEKVAGVAGVLAFVPACLAAGAIGLAATRDPRPATLAFRGVALYALTVTGAAVAYVLARPA